MPGYILPEREAQLDQLVERVNEWGRWEDTDVTENTDSPVADYVAWGWKEGDWEELITRAQDGHRCQDLAPLVNLALERKVERRKLVELLVDACGGATFVGGIHYRDNELFGLTIGEEEHQRDVDASDPDCLVKALCLLTDDEFSYVARHSDYSPHRYVGSYWHVTLYTCHDYDRWSLVCDPAAFAELLRDYGVITDAELAIIADGGEVGDA